jgi:N-acetyl-alpha-D-glucosaminyl L-malate synthase BshA
LEKKHKNIFFHKVQINEYSLFKYPDYTLPLAVAIEEVQKRYGLDVVHVHYAVPHATAALLAKRIMRQNGMQAPKIITTLHGTDITLLAKDPALYEIIKYSVERSDGVTAVSQNLKNDTVKFLNTEKDIEVIYNFYSPPAPQKTSATIRKELRIKDNDIVAIHLSNVRPVKRIPDLLKVAAKMKAQKNFKLLILSGGDFKPFQPLVKKLRISNQLIVKENVKDIENYLNAADLGLYTSETESFGMGILETMSYGKPVLATKAGGVPEVIEDKKTGFLYRVGDIAGFTKGINTLARNPELTKAFGQRALERAHNLFNTKKIVEHYENYYLDILGVSHKHRH